MKHEYKLFQNALDKVQKKSQVRNEYVNKKENMNWEKCYDQVLEKLVCRGLLFAKIAKNRL